MKPCKLFIITLLSWLSITTYAQNDSLMESMMTRKVLYCPDVTLNTTTILPDLHAKGEKKLVNDMLIYWTKKCGEQNAALIAFKTLYNIENNNFKEEFFRYQYLMSYMRASDSLIYVYDVDYKQFIDVQYFPYIREWSKELLRQNTNYSIVEHFLLEFYANPSDSLLEKLSDDKFNRTTLQKERKAHISFAERGNKRFVGITSGVWIPNGQLSVLGSHPYIGLQVIHRERKFDICFGLNFRFLNAPHKYQVLKDDSLFTTKKYFTAFVGFDGTYKMVHFKRSAIELIGGFGYDGLSITLINYNDEDKKDLTKNVGSLNINAGLAYNYDLKNKSRSTLGVEARHHFINYRNTGGTPLTGNAVTIGLRYCFH